MSNDRRNFLKHVGTGAAAVAAVSAATKTIEAAPAGSRVEVLATQPGERIKISLELDGAFAGWLDDFEGGDAVGEVVTEKMGGDWVAKKHIGGFKWSEISIKCGIGMGKGLYDWIKHSFDKGHERKNGAIIVADYDYNTRSVLQFTQALVTELSMPALDAASKDAAKMTLKFKPEYTRKQLTASRPAPAEKVKQKAWLCSNFRLRIDGLEEACSRVNKIEAITIKQKVTENAVGEQRDYEQTPAIKESGDLACSGHEALLQQFAAWHEDFVIKGNNDETQERSGSLEFLSPAGETYIKIEIGAAGVHRFAPDKTEAGAEGIRRVKAEMYCEDVRFTYNGAATFG